MDIAETVERHDKDLYRGNGKPGLTFRIGEATDTTINGTTGSFTNTPNSIGRNNLASLGEYLNGDLAELVMYSGQLTSAQITILETYFNSRYGL